DDFLKSAKPSAVMFQAINSALSDLLITEGERRRVRLEIERGQAEGQVLEVADMFRDRLGLAKYAELERIALPDQLPSAIDPITGQDWTVLQFLQALRLDLSLLTGVDESPGNPDGTGNELLEGNLCPNPVLADNADGWVDLNDGEIERQEITDHIAADYAARVSFD